MTILQVIGDYLAIIKDNAVPPCPKTYIFAGKAAPSYNFAKLIIKLINNVAEVVNNDPRVNDRIKVVFVPDYKVSLVKISDIVYLESEGEYVRMHLADGTTITTLFRLKNMETALPSESFMRVHRSYIVNLRTIKAYVKGRIFLNDTEYVPIGENYKEAFQGYIDKNFRNL